MRLFKQFSFYTPSINLSKVYYGPYLYDRKHKMITCYLDEFDDDVIMMPGVREKDQAGFPEDLKNAYDESNSKAVYNYFFADETRKYDDLPCTLSHRMLARQVYGRTVV